MWPPPRIEVPESVTTTTPSPTPEDDESQREKKVNTAKRWWGATPLKKAPLKKRPSHKREQTESVPWVDAKKTLKRAERIVHKQSKFQLERPELHHVEDEDWSDTASVCSHISVSEDDRGRRYSFLMPEEGLPGSRRGSTDRGRSASPMGGRSSEIVRLRPTERQQPKPVEKPRIEPVPLKPVSERHIERSQPRPQQQQPMTAEEGRISPTEQEMQEASPWARGLVGQGVQYTSETAPWATGSVQLKAVEAGEKKVFEKPQLATVELRPLPDYDDDILRRRSMDARGEPEQAPQDAQFQPQPGAEQQVPWARGKEHLRTAEKPEKKRTEKPKLEQIGLRPVPKPEELPIPERATETVPGDEESDVDIDSKRPPWARRKAELKPATTESRAIEKPKLGKVDLKPLKKVEEATGVPYKMEEAEKLDDSPKDTESKAHSVPWAPGKVQLKPTKPEEKVYEKPKLEPVQLKPAQPAKTPQDTAEEQGFEFVKSSSESSFEKVDIIRSSSAESFEMVDKSAIPKDHETEQATAEPTKDVQPVWRAPKKPKDKAQPSKPEGQETPQKPLEKPEEQQPWPRGRKVKHRKPTAPEEQPEQKQPQEEHSAPAMPPKKQEPEGVPLAQPDLQEPMEVPWAHPELKPSKRSEPTDEQLVDESTLQSAPDDQFGDTAHPSARSLSVDADKDAKEKQPWPRGRKPKKGTPTEKKDQPHELVTEEDTKPPLEDWVELEAPSGKAVPIKPDEAVPKKPKRKPVGDAIQTSKEQESAIPSQPESKQEAEDVNLKKGMAPVKDQELEEVPWAHPKLKPSKRKEYEPEHVTVDDVNLKKLPEQEEAEVPVEEKEKKVIEVEPFVPTEVPTHDDIELDDLELDMPRQLKERQEAEEAKENYEK